MPKRGESLPWRMVYRWPSTGLDGREAYSTFDRAFDAACRQVERVGGQSHERDCLVTVDGREIGTVEHLRACPSCGRATRWDTEHRPVAWRHVAHDSHWCSVDDTGEPRPTMPPRTEEHPENVWAGVA
jgi:hypothetical protein